MAGYLVGNICGAVILSRLLMRSDIRKLGSNNAGTTNMTRVFGLKYGIATFLIDLLKAVVCVFVCKYVMSTVGGTEAGLFAGYLAGLAVIAGHNYPVLLGFKGGKGFASGIGVLIVLQPLPTLIILSGGILLLLIVDRMSIFALAFFVAEALYTWIYDPAKTLWIPLFVTLYLLLAVIAHWPNIQRLARGQEQPLGILRRIRAGVKHSQ
ncbi:glycerol-3-phosphate acyltransferase [Paenibacillus sp. FSL R7-0331]|uniref:glycerol-3-phosphate acyltransferase n=1 Tax=Paenibacillus sp. FSL R7-0331 TaxID=1536773 RepID=UPI000A53A308|nr:glycerol-3-phosphate acyltransferase [Paenibacillus sp. FSL R7-0331]